eukprot:m.245290 g.245290  ORF g.245290 m.245290 type:complete len:143 (-) comp14662_c0_seq1:231-659(-)
MAVLASVRASLFSLSKRLLQPSVTTLFLYSLVAFTLLSGGVIYDVIVKPPGMGEYVDSNGRFRPQPFMEGPLNGQYILEGLVSAFLFAFGGVGFILLDTVPDKTRTVFQRNAVFVVALGMVLIAYIALRVFMGIKLSEYLVW